MPPCTGTSTPRIATNAFCLARKPGLNKKTLNGPASRQQRFNRSNLQHSDTLAAIHRTSLILPKILPPATSSVWRKLLCTSSDIISGSAVPRNRIAVLGLDELCRPRDLVSALLDDPLVFDHGIIHNLRNREAQSSSDLMTISHKESEHFQAQLYLSLPWLKRLDVDIIEIPAGHPDTIPLLYDTDIQIMVTSPRATPLSLEYQYLLSRPGSFLVLDYPIFDEFVVNYTVSQLARLFPTVSNTLKTKIIQVYPPRALSALDFFREEANSVEAIQTFQNDFLSSGVTTLSQAIARVLSPDRGSHRAQCVLTGALEACHNATQLGSHDVVKVQQCIDELRSRISGVETASMQEAFGGNDAPEVGKSVRRSTREMQAVMDAIPWWKLPLKVDDLSEVLFHTAERVWCRDLHAKLEFHTGRLASLRSRLTEHSLESLRLLPASFQSAVLLNQLHQLSARPPGLSPSTLTYPLSYRLQQLRQPIHSLHRRAQRAMLTVSVTTLGSAGGAYVVWIMEWMTPATAMGLGALGSIAGLRWFIGSWERGKTRWWEDWRRVGSGLQRDIKELLALVIKEKVTSTPIKVAEELENMVIQRAHELTELNEELESIAGSCRQELEQNSPVK